MNSSEVAVVRKQTGDSRRPQLRIDFRTRVFLVQAVAIGAAVTLWQIAASHNWVNGKLFGSPAGIVASFEVSAANGSLLNDTIVTVSETVYGFVLGTVLGTACGLGLWYSRFLACVIEPIAVAFNGVPKIALGPMIIIWIGSGTSSKVALAFVSTFIVALVGAYAASREVDPDLITLLRSFGANRLAIFTKLLFPSTLPLVISAMRINVGFALVGAIAGEFISAQYGLGKTIFVAGNLFDLNTVWLYLIVLSIVAAIMYMLVGLLERALVKGRG